MSNNYCVIMAGGVGSRFWPLSRVEKPKQFLDVLGIGRSLLQQTFDRLTRIAPPENIYIVSNSIYKDLIKEQLPELSDDQILLEPMRRNTAPCIAYANYKIAQKNPNANIVVAPSDHLILKEDEFVSIIEKGLDFTANNEALLTLGIKPHRPETGYGYIQIKNTDKQSLPTNKVEKVKTFTEKPNLDMAKVFFESKEFFWNSGIFLWSLKSISGAFAKHLQEVDSLFAKGAGIYGTDNEEEFIYKTYSECKNISIDYGVMEKAENVHVIGADFGWSDLGTWGSLYESKGKDEHNNAIAGSNVLTFDTQNCIVSMPDDKLAVIQGLDDYIVVDADGTLLICRKDDEQQIKQFVNDVKMYKGEQYL